jgi:hypothetical protein
LHVDTLGPRIDAAVIGIGALFFNFDTEEREVHHWPITLTSNGERVVSPLALDYWRSDEAPYPALYSEETVDLDTALAELGTLYLEHSAERGELRVWSWDAQEAAVLQSCYEGFYVPIPWPFYTVWDGSTIFRAVGMHTPTGGSPEDQMLRRRQALITADGVCTADRRGRAA